MGYTLYLFSMCRRACILLASPIEEDDEDMQPTASDWSRGLHSARKTLRLSRNRLSRIAGVSAETIKAYELGLRHPTRSLLVAILDGLKLERNARNNILADAGFSPDGGSLGPDRFSGYQFSPQSAKCHVDAMPWPAFILNDYAEVTCCNPLTERLWGIELEREFPNMLDRNMLSVASNPRFADRVENWEEMMRVGIGVFKGHHLGAEAIDNASPYFSRILERFLQGDPKYVGRMMNLWQETPPHEPKVRWEYEVHWNEPGIGRMSFLAVVNTANADDGLAFNDWMPVNAVTWQRLGRLRRR